MKFITPIIMLITVTFLCEAQNSKVEIEEVNSARVEYAPSISADGTVMIFQSDRSGKYELYETKLGSEGWSNPEPLKGEINTYGTERDLIGGPSISYDGNRLFFFASFDGGYGSEDIYYSDRTNEGWNSPVNMGKVINSKNYEGFPNISSDGKSLYFMRLNKNIVQNLNCYTLMVSQKNENGSWSSPKALPDPINQGCEKYPRIMPDNQTLIFSSIREESVNNSFDMYEVFLNEDGKWSEIKAMTFSNTPEHDYFSAVSSKFDKMYTNAKGSTGYDIYSYDIPLEFKPKHKIVNIQGIVKGDSHQPVTAKIKVNDLKRGVEIIDLENNSSSGAYTLVLGEGNYQLIVESGGYQKYTEKIVLPEIKDYELIKKDIQLKPFQQKVILSTSDGRSGNSIQAELMVTSGKQEITVDNNSFIADYGKEYQILAKQNGYQELTISHVVKSLDSTEVVRDVTLTPQRPEVKILPRDAESGEEIAVNFMLRDLTHKKTLFKSKLDKDTTITLDFNSKFRLYAVSKNHLFVKDIIDLKEQSGYEFIEYPLELQAIKPGAKLTLKEIYFEFGSAELDKSSYDELAAVYNFLKYNKSLVVEISAHTDNVGSLNDNLELSESRARSVVEYLAGKGVPSRMMEGKGYGESQPISNNNTKAGRAKNRRVEFKILKVRGT